MDYNNIQVLAGRKMLYQAEPDVQDAIEWVKAHKQDIDNFIATNGALLLRGLPVDNGALFGNVLTTLFGEELANYTYRSTPRKEVNNNVYTATEYHASEVIPQHNENSYANSWPERIGFLCVTPAARMGNTPLSDSREAYRLIPAEIREEFERKQVMYVRNYSDLDLPWQEVFQTEDKLEVEAFCRNNRMKYEWTEQGLRTSQVNQATIIHRATGEKIWFNQAHLFHVSSMNEEVKEGLLSLLGEEFLPRNTYFGDGSPIPDEVLDLIRKVYEDTKFSFKWEKNDLLLLDNMLFTHGREPYEGERKVLVGMARKYVA